MSSFSVKVTQLPPSCDQAVCNMREYSLLRDDLDGGGEGVQKSFSRKIPSSAFRDIRQEKVFFDVTVACDDEQLQAHKVILSASSSFFKKILRHNQHQYPLL